MHKLGPTGFHRNFDFGNHDDSQQICNLSRKGAKIRNQYNQVTHPTQDTTLESDKNTNITKIVSLIRINHNHKPQTYPWHCKKEPNNHHKTPGRQSKQSNQLSLPHQDDCKTRMGHNGSHNKQKVKSKRTTP